MLYITWQTENKSLRVSPTTNSKHTCIIFKQFLKWKTVSGLLIIFKTSQIKVNTGSWTNCIVLNHRLWSLVKCLINRWCIRITECKVICNEMEFNEPFSILRSMLNNDHCWLLIVNPFSNWSVLLQRCWKVNKFAIFFVVFLSVALTNKYRM